MTITQADDTARGEPAGTRQEVIDLARGGGLNLVGAITNQAVLFILTLVLARRLSSHAVGLYSQAAGFLALLDVLCMSGFRAGLTRFVAVHRADGDAASLRGTVRIGLGISLGTAVVLGTVLFAGARVLAEAVFDDPELATLLRFVALILPSVVFTHAALSATQGYKTMRYFAGIGLLTIPLVKLTLALILLFAGTGLRGVMIAILLAEFTGAVLSAAALRKLMGPATTSPRYRARELLGFSAVSWLATLASTGLIWADILILGMFRPNSEVGIYQVAARLAMFTTLAMAPINQSFAPSISDLWHRGRMDGLRRTYSAATSWMLRLSLPTFIVLMVFPREALSLFGPEFAVGVSVVLILVVGKLTDAATGPCGLMLNQSGRVALSMADNVVVLVLNIGLNVYLIPRHGIVGSAAAWTISLVVVNVARLIQVRSTMGMVPFSTAWTKGAVASLVALGIGVAVQVEVDGMWALLVGLPTVALVYLAVLLSLGLPADDQLVGRDLARRLRLWGPTSRFVLPEGAEK